MKKLSKVEVTFCVDGKEFDLEDFSNTIGIEPTYTRTKKDWPKVIKENSNLPYDLQPRYTWELSISNEHCTDIELPVKQMIAKLSGKEEFLNHYIRKNHLHSAFIISIWAEDVLLPAMIFTPDILKFFGRINTEISLDICVNP